MIVKKTVSGTGDNRIYTVVYLDTTRLDNMMRQAAAGGTLDTLVQKAAFDVEKTAKRLCPVDTGTLANSIRAEQVQRSGATVYADIGAHTDYAYWVEIGHTTSAGTYVMGHHYMTRALYQEAPKLDRAVAAWARSLGK